MYEEKEALQIHRTNFDEQTKLWSNFELPPMFNPNISVGQLIFHALTINGNKIAQISDDTGIRMTFGEIRWKTVCATQNLKKRGYKPKQVFGFMCRNSHHLSPILFAAFCMGCPINPVYYLSQKDDIIRVFGKTKPFVVFCDVQNYPELKKALTELENGASIFTFGGSTDGSEPVENLFVETGFENYFRPETVDGINDTFAIMSTSGTTGTSKCIKVSHANFINMKTALDLANVDDIMLCFSTIYWGCGLSVLMLGTLYGAVRIITTENGGPELFLQLIERYRVTWLMNDPYELASVLKSNLINKADLSSVKKQLVIGSKMPSDMKRNLEHFFPNGTADSVYGITEFGGFLSSAGGLAAGSQVKVLHKYGNRCGIGVQGEICVKLAYEILGYLNDKAATAAAFDDEGFFHTGDLGYFDTNGALHITDRKIHMLQYRGNWILPSDIEDVLFKLPDIEIACVVGIPNAITYEMPAAAIVKCINSTTTENDVQNLVATHLSDHMKLRGGVYFVDTLPMTPSGKIKRKEVLKMIVEVITENRVIFDMTKIETNFS